MSPKNVLKVNASLAAFHRPLSHGLNLIQQHGGANVRDVCGTKPGEATPRSHSLAAKPREANPSTNSGPAKPPA